MKCLRNSKWVEQQEKSFLTENRKFLLSNLIFIGMNQMNDAFVSTNLFHFWLNKYVLAAIPSYSHSKNAM